MANFQENFITEDADILPPSNDRIFKAMLTHPDAKQVLIDIISTVIEQKVTDVQIRNNELPVMDTDEKGQRFDVNCTIENGDQVDVEMHCEEDVEIGVKHTAFEKWSLFLNYAQDRVHRNLINDIIKDKEEISMAASLLQEISKDEHERAKLRSQRMYETDQYSNYHTAIELGEIRSMHKIARNALAEGSTPEFIQKITGLSLEDINKL
ncbi:MAG: Rpn family recombination-promoting nuclease/putative transposase [Treponema sp.]|nr:Rpn family recombination-promoting nuclease/putative transposase [Treponema sp.]